MKKILAIVAVAISGVAFGQQHFQTSQYTQNMYVLNPAASGLSNDIDINLGHRSQWVGLENAPTTYYLTANSMLGKNTGNTENMFSLRISDPSITSEDGYETDADNTVIEKNGKHAFGGILFRDEAGAFSKTAGFLSYAYHITLGKNARLSAGVKLGLSNVNFDPNLARVVDQNDNTFTGFVNNRTNKTMLDGGIGLFFYSKNLYIGYSLDQMFANELEFDPSSTASLQGHHHINAGYKIALSENLAVTPSAMLRLTSGSNPSFDINAKFDIKDRFFVGGGLRAGDAIIAMAGLKITDRLGFGYSYDATTSDVQTVSSGSHELVLNLLLSK